MNTVQDLFGIRDSLDLTFAPDALNGFAFDTSNDFRVDARLGPQYRAMAEALATRAVTEAGIFERILPCDPAAPDCADEFLRTFGERVFRRPLDAEELGSFRQLFDLGGQVLQSGDDFRDGAQLALEALLQAPQFLYRTEAGTSTNPEGRIPLSDWELASRLSHFLYDSMPDAELFEAARAGQLHTPEQIEAAARRMLTQPRVADKLSSFHEQAWQFGRFSRISPDATTYPNVPDNFIARVRRSAELFVGEVLGTGGGLEELLTAPYAFVDGGLAPRYGVPSPSEGGSFERVEFSDGSRQGLLTQVGFLASNSYSIRTDPIHRGLFVIRNLLCRQVSATGLACLDPDIQTRATPYQGNAALALEEAQYPTVADLQIDIFALALACDMTRVATLHFDRGSGGPTFRWDGMSHEYNHHKLSHGKVRDDCFGESTANGCDNVAGFIDMIFDIDRWHQRKFARLLERLDAYVEADGRTVLDNSAILYANEMSDGKLHSFMDLPFIIAGSAGGRFRQNLYFPLGPEGQTDASAPHNRLLNTILNVMGVQSDWFGLPEGMGGPTMQGGIYQELLA